MLKDLVGKFDHSLIPFLSSYAKQDLNHGSKCSPSDADFFEEFVMADEFAEHLYSLLSRLN